MSVLRPLPDRPNLEFDRKAAKELLRQLRAGEPDALERATARGASRSEDTSYQLSDAQLIVAREYGFASWPRLVQYHADAVRQSGVVKDWRSPADHEQEARRIIARHSKGDVWTARMLASAVPRFYGLSLQEVLASVVNDADAQLAVARNAGMPSWRLLIEAAAKGGPWRAREWGLTPLQQAFKVAGAGDLDALRQIVRDHPELLTPSAYEVSVGASLGNVATSIKPSESPEKRAIVEWLASVGFSRQLELNRRLCGQGLFRNVDQVEKLLAEGADPNWIAPNGIPVLEHALVRYWNGAAVDVLASRTTPRKALWISAGLGDVDGVASFLDRNGKPTAAARELRSPFDAIGVIRIPPLVDPDDEELLLEALMIAAMNGRANVITYLASRGANLDSVRWGVPVVNLAVGNAWLESAEALIRAGANLDIPSQSDSNGSAREMARHFWESGHHGAQYRRIVELCGLDPDAIAAERDAKPVPEPQLSDDLVQALAFANRYAIAHGAAMVAEQHLLFGLLRLGKLPLLYFTQVSRMDRERFHREIHPRVEEISALPEPRPDSALPLHEEVRVALDDAVAMARQRRNEWVEPVNALYALTKRGSGYAVDLLNEYGGSLEHLNHQLRREVLRES